MAKKKAVKADDPTPVPPGPQPRDWTNAGEDYVPADMGIDGLAVADEAMLAQTIADANQAVTDKKNAKQIVEVLLQSIKVGANLFRGAAL